MQFHIFWKFFAESSTIDLIDLIDTRLVKVIGFKFPEVFIMFYLKFLSLLLSIFISIIAKPFEYAI